MSSIPGFLDGLLDALIAELAGLGIDCETVWEPIPPTRLYRVSVVSDDFENMRHDERQSLVWRIAEEALSSAELRRVSIIMTLTRDEAEEEDDEEEDEDDEDE